MKLLESLSRLLVEKRIGQVSANIEVVLGFDILSTKHSVDRSVRTGISNYNQTPITNSEIVELVSFFRREIAERIVNGEIQNDIPFAIKSIDRNLAAIVSPNMESNLYWKLVVVTVFREDENNRLKTFRGQVVLRK
jgi:hypothetical protein